MRYYRERLLLASPINNNQNHSPTAGTARPHPFSPLPELAAATAAEIAMEVQVQKPPPTRQTVRCPSAQDNTTAPPQAARHADHDNPCERSLLWMALCHPRHTKSARPPDPRAPPETLATHHQPFDNNPSTAHNPTLNPYLTYLSLTLVIPL